MRYHDLLLLTGTGAVVMDLLEGRIDNRWILMSLVCGLFSHTIRDGPSGLLSGMAGVILVFVLLFWMHFFHMLGAGDVKLFCAMGAFLGPVGSLRLLAGAFLSGAFYSFFYLSFTGSFRRRFRYFIQYVRQVLSTGERIPYIQSGPDRPENFHFTWPILVSLCLIRFQ